MFPERLLFHVITLYCQDNCSFLYHLFLSDAICLLLLTEFEIHICYKYIQIVIFIKQNSNKGDATTIKSPASGDDEE